MAGQGGYTPRLLDILVGGILADAEDLVAADGPRRVGGGAPGHYELLGAKPPEHASGRAYRCGKAYTL